MWVITNGIAKPEKPHSDKSLFFIFIILVCWNF
jgi:hypothetical protein